MSTPLFAKKPTYQIATALLLTVTALTSSADTTRIAIDTNKMAQQPTIVPELFGINSRWIDAGDGIVKYGEMIRDRSFRLQNSKTKQRWIESPNPETSGKIRYKKKGGDDSPWGGKGSEGFMELSQKSQGYTCISQQIIGTAVAGQRYALNFSATGLDGPAGISAFFVDNAFLPVEKLDNLVTVGDTNWGNYELTLEPDQTNEKGLFRICLVTAGQIGIDEVRLHQLGGTPRVSPIAHQRIKELKVKSLRWPSGSDADHFNWRGSIGPLRYRQESEGIFAAFQTPSWGLHEFLDYCEKNGLEPLITVNVLQPPEDSADLVEYILAPSSTPMGKLRADNGRMKPWDVTHFELGNEPTTEYKADRMSWNAGKGYVTLARTTAQAMREKALDIDKAIELKGVLETTFALASWVKIVPTLSRWNPAVTDQKEGLLSHIDQVKGHFYSAFTWRNKDPALFAEVMAGGTTITTLVDNLRTQTPTLPAFWLTEYSLMIEKKNPSRIQIDRLNDYQSGLAVADLLMSAINAKFGGAYLFNLAEHGTWGVLANNNDFRLRPAGIVFSLLADLSQQHQLPVSIANNWEITVEGGDGNTPSNFSYPGLEVIASYRDNQVFVYLLNRSHDQQQNIAIDFATPGYESVLMERIGPAALRATNEIDANNIAIEKQPAPVANKPFPLPPRSLTRLVYRQ